MRGMTLEDWFAHEVDNWISGPSRVLNDLPEVVDVQVKDKEVHFEMDDGSIVIVSVRVVR